MNFNDTKSAFLTEQAIEPLWTHFEYVLIAQFVKKHPFVNDITNNNNNIIQLDYTFSNVIQSNFTRLFCTCCPANSLLTQGLSELGTPSENF